MQREATNRTNRARRVWAGGLLLLGTACGGGSSEPSHDPVGEPDPNRLICPECERAGGETSDFGDGTPPDPCEAGVTGSSIDAAGAATLGFGEVLARLTQTFELPLAWTVQDVAVGLPAAGYAPLTQLQGSTRVTTLERLAATTLCTERLRVGLEVGLSTADGALSLAGPMTLVLRQGSTAVPFVRGWLDMSTARGTLELHPPESSGPVAMDLTVLIYFWPEGLRTGLIVRGFSPGTRDDDVVSFSYRPLAGRAPVDACEIHQQPLGADSPVPGWPGVSPRSASTALGNRLGAGAPLPGEWSTGAATTLNVQLGDPRDVCQQGSSLTYAVPVRLASDDGRVAIARDGRANVSLSPEGAVVNGFVEAYDHEGLHAGGFAALSGISGVDFDGISGGTWHLEDKLPLPENSPAQGQLVIEGVDLDGGRTGIAGAFMGVLERLAW